MGEATAGQTPCGSGQIWRLVGRMLRPSGWARSVGGTLAPVGRRQRRAGTGGMPLTPALSPRAGRGGQARCASVVGRRSCTAVVRWAKQRPGDGRGRAAHGRAAGPPPPRPSPAGGGGVRGCAMRLRRARHRSCRARGALVYSVLAPRRSGGIGRRARFRAVLASASVGSSPTSGTIHRSQSAVSAFDGSYEIRLGLRSVRE
jgi:hypothetical protein